MNQKEEKKPELFTIPQEVSWHFERILKPDDKTIHNYVLIEPGASDIVKVLKAYSPHPVPGYDIGSIEIVYNEQLNRIFSGHMITMNKRKGNAKYTPTWKTQPMSLEKRHREATYQIVQQLAESHRDSNVSNILLLPLWHGTSEAVAQHIFNTGYGIFNSLDPQFVTDEGYFGRGVYTAHEAEYSYRCYAQRHGDKAVLLLNWVSTLEAYPVIDGDMPKVKGIQGGYDNCDAHFIPVRSPQHPHTNLYYPCDPHEKSQYLEMVVFNPAQCLPRYQVKLVKSTPKPSIDASAVSSYQMGLDFFGLGQYAQVSSAFEEAHDAGHPTAYIRLHWLHSGGNGILPVNSAELMKYQTPSKETIAWIKQKANYRGKNDHEAQFNLAWCHQHGLGIEVNLAKSAQYYWVAATQGHRDAQYQLGVCCSSGIGVKQNMQQAIGYYEQAAKQGHVQAHYVLSQCYALGLGVLANATKAKLHQQAAQKWRHPQLVTEQARVQSDQEIQQLKQQLNQLQQTTSQLEKALQISKDRELSLKLQLEEASRLGAPQQLLAPPRSPSGVDFGDVFHPPVSSVMKSHKATMTYANQVEAMAKTVQDKINPMELSALLKWVTEGHLVEVETLLKKNPALTLGTRTVKDLSDRPFNQITALQYAAWALDREMCDLIMRYAGEHDSAIQLKALWEAPEHYSAHGASYDITPLIKKTETYLNNWCEWKDDERCRYWQKDVGGEQRKCPAWLIIHGVKEEKM